MSSRIQPTSHNFELLRYDTTSMPHVAVVTLDSSFNRNALTSKMCLEICTALRSAETDPDIGVIVMKSAGPAFCAGGDIKAMANRTDIFAGDGYDLAASYRSTIQEIPRTFETLTKATIAAIDGPAIGAGLDLACMFDLRVATTKAKFSESFAGLGLISGIGGAFFLTRLVGTARATEMTLTGRTVSAQEAKDWGLVHRLCSSENGTIQLELDETIQELCKSILKQSRAAIAQSKVLLRQAQSTSLAEHLTLCSSLQGLLQTREDHLTRLPQPSQ